MATTWEVRYAHTSDGIDVAYAVLGEGPRDLLLIHGFTTHLDFVGDSAWHSYWLRRLSQHFRVIQFDKRGVGLSERTLGHGSIEDRTRDAVAVLDAARSRRASVVGISEGGPMALTLAATYPERVENLVLYGTFARLLWAPDYEIGVAPEQAQSFVEWTRDRWGHGEVIGSVFLTHAPDPEAATRAMAKFERNACTPQMAAEVIQRNVEIDVRALLPALSVPTLVMHNTRDPLVPVAVGRYLANHIAGAEYEEADGDFHATWLVSEFEPLIERALGFLANLVTDPKPPTQGERSGRSVATVLFTDIVGSTDLAARLGDDGWRQVLEEHDRRAREATRQFGGRFVKSTGDGILAVFDGPSRAIRAAQALSMGIRDLDLRTRAGIHTGEIELRGNDVAGIGVHIASRVMALAHGDEVMASRTVKDLAAGSGIEFSGRGVHTLNGVPGEWELYAVD